MDRPAISLCISAWAKRRGPWWRFAGLRARCSRSAKLLPTSGLRRPSPRIEWRSPRHKPWPESNKTKEKSPAHIDCPLCADYEFSAARPGFPPVPAVAEAMSVTISKWKGTAPAARAAIALLALLIAGPQIKAQSSNAELSGVVTDTSGAVVSGAQIKALNTATNVTYAAESNASGLYLLSELLPGPFTITATAPGFGTVRKSGLKLSTGDHLAQNFTLKPGAVEESVTVTGAQTLISSDEASSANVLNNKMITELPQLNRNALDLTSTTPSIQGSGPPVDQIGNLGNAAYLIANTGNSYSISGGQVNGTSIYVDGNPVQEAEFNATNRSIPTPDSIGEFRVDSGVLTADKGRYAGGIISMETQTGTNTYHGRAFFYFRNENLNSNDWTDNSLGNPRQKFNQKNYGLAAGGPVKIPHLYNGTNHTFFYAAWEGERFSEGATIISSVPTLLNQQGDFSQTVINVSDGVPVTANIYDPFFGAYDSNQAHCTGPLAEQYASQGNCWVRPQFPGNQIPATYGSGVSGQS